MWLILLFAILVIVLYQNFKLENHEKCEEKVLRKYIKNTKYQVLKVQISNSNFLNTFQTEFDKSKPNFVLLHGFGGGIAIWSKLIDQLSVHYNVFALDLLGFGQSSKPTFTGTEPEESISFWIDSLKEWIERMQLKKFTLLGHSLGYVKIVLI